MMRSLYSGVSGLKTHQTKMDVIGNNIANVNTVAYKSSSITFSELMYQTTQSASGPNATTGTAGINAKQIGLGVTTGAINTAISTAGATQTTGNPFDIQITGDSFFVVSDGSTNYFTRAGAFYVDAAGNLAMTSTGYNVMGWGVNETGTEIKQDTVQALRIMSAANMTYSPEATSKAYVSGIIDKNDTNVNSDSGKILNLSFYDNLGYSYTAKLSVKTVGDGTTGEYSVELVDILDSENASVLDDFPGIQLGTSGINIADATTMSVATGYTMTATTLTYDNAGTPTTINIPADVYSAGAYNTANLEKLAAAYGYEGETDEFLNMYVTDTSVTPSVNYTINQILTGAAGGNTLGTFMDTTDFSIASTGHLITGAILGYNTSTGAFASINGTTTATSITLSLTNGGTNGNFKDITIDFATSSMYDNNGTSTVAATAGDTDGVGTGRKLGDMSGVSIQNNGMIYASYDNGMTRLLGQIAVAEFSNASGLQKEGDNLYSATLNSGAFDGIGTDITSNSGYMSTGVLEMSNVDLSAEFTEMITTQRGFQASSRIITVSDTMLEELTNLKR